MKFLKTSEKVTRGFRTSDHDRKMIRGFLGESEGALMVNLVRVSDGYKDYGLSAIWTSGKIKVVDPRFESREDDSYVVEIVSIRYRQKGERV